MSNLTKDQLTNLVDEFVSFQINDMSQEDIYQYLRDIMRQEIICQRNHLTLQESLKEQIDEYDENLYEILEDYVTDTVGSYTALQEYIHDRHANDWIDS
jgi:polyhydroxyalkanoate synthesis regulator phasin